MRLSYPHRLANLIAFLCGASSLSLEIVAGRILAPHLGVSLFTWTAVIGIVLAGLALGAWAGGLLADRWPSPAALGLVIFAAGLASLLVLPAAQLSTDRTTFRLDCRALDTDFASSICSPLVVTLGRILGLTGAIFLLPALLLGMVTPLAARLCLASLRSAGRAVGSLYACSTLGSITGVFLTGFLLIRLVGTRPIVLGIGLGLVMLAPIGGLVWRLNLAPRLASAALGLLLVTVLLRQIDQRQALSSGCSRETDYFCIKVYDQSSERGQPLRVLALDHLVHSYSALDDPLYYEYPYVRIYAELADYTARARPDFRALFLGGGGYTLPRGLELRYTQAALEVIEIDPAVTQSAREQLGLSPTSRVLTYSQDARLAVDQLQGESGFDLIFGDAFNDLAVPYHLTTLEFDRTLRGLLRDDGIYLVNVIDDFSHGAFLPSVARTLRQVFPYVYLLATTTPWSYQSSAPSTYILAASAVPLDLDRLSKVTPLGVGGRLMTRVWPSAEVDRWLQDAPGVILTDDFAPTDSLLAPLFSQRAL